MSIDGETWLSMTVIERVRYVHRRFVKNNEIRSYEFKIQCAMQLQMPGFGHRSDQSVITAFDNYFQLGYRTGQVWLLVNTILDMWNHGDVKGQKTDIDNGNGMKLTQWQNMQGIYDEAIVIPVLEKVVRKQLTLKEMGQEFAQYKLIYTVQQAFVKALQEKTWSGCKARYKEHTTSNVIKKFVPLFKGWKDPNKKKRAFTSELTEFPDVFSAHIKQARMWFQKQTRTATERSHGRQYNVLMSP